MLEDDKKDHLEKDNMVMLGQSSPLLPPPPGGNFPGPPNDVFDNTRWFREYLDRIGYFDPIKQVLRKQMSPKMRDYLSQKKKKYREIYLKKKEEYLKQKKEKENGKSVWENSGDK